MTDISAAQLLAQMRAMADVAQGAAAKPQQVQDGPDFAKMLHNSLSQISEVQKNAGDLSARFEKGDPQVDLTDVMVSMQKASVSFQAMVQTRNKLLSAYQDIMSMPI